MNSDQIEGTWKQLKGKIKERWGQLTDDQLDIVSGNWDRLSGLIQTHYGEAKEEAERANRLPMVPEATHETNKVLIQEPHSHRRQTFCSENQDACSR